MPDQAALISFLIATFALEMTPGPNMAWLALLSATAGLRAGLAATFGIALGLALQGGLAALGMAAFLDAWPGLARAVHLAGVGYLVWLAWQSWRDAGDVRHHQPGGGETATDGFRRGLVSNLLNPKALVFFVAVLPGFLPDPPGATGAVALTAIYVGVATSVHLVIVAAAGTLRDRLADPAVSVQMHRVQAAALLAVAAWLLTRG